MKLRPIFFNKLDVDDRLKLDMNRIVVASSMGAIFLTAISGPPFSGFIRSLGVSHMLYGVLMALPVISGLFQAMSAYLMGRIGSRKKAFLIGGFIHRFPYIPMVLLPLLFPACEKSIMLVAIVFFMMLSAIGDSFNYVAFYSWMPAIIPENIRGRFFSCRQAVYTLTTLLSGLLIGYILDLAEGFVGFAIVFSIVSMFGLSALIFYFKIHDPPLNTENNSEMKFINIWKSTLDHKNYKQYLIFWAVWIFGYNMAVPFYNIYMLEYLKMGYTHIVLSTQIVLNILSIVFINLWGRLVDRKGSLPILGICGIAVVSVPILWCFATPVRYFWLVPIIHIILGIFNCGIKLASNNIMMGLPPERDKAFYIANFSMVNTLAGNVLAYTIGGFLMDSSKKWLDEININFSGIRITNYHILFILSFIIQLIGIIFLLPKVKERRTFVNIIESQTTG